VEVLIMTLQHDALDTAVAENTSNGAARPATRIRTAIYEIFVDRFAGANGAQLEGVPANKPWHHHCGGTLDGICERLDYIQSVGADAIYLTPIFTAPSNHKYDASTYEHVEPRFGGDAAFERLVEECQRRDIGLILDGVFNHVGTEHHWFHEAKADTAAPRRDHFKWNGHPHGYECWRGHSSLPELNLKNPEVSDALFESETAVIRHWLQRGATGWRLDCANDLGMKMCARATDAAHRERPIDGVIGEIMTYAEDWLIDGGLDGVMNYYFRETVLALVNSEINVPQAAYNLKRMARRYPKDRLVRSWNMLASHDTPRLATEVPDAARRRMAQVMAYAFPGVPMIYYGEEIGMEGGHDPDCRRPMRWNAEQQDDATLKLTRQLNELRRTQPALRNGNYLPLPQPGTPEILSFARTTDNPWEQVLVVANASGQPFEGRVFTPYSYLFDSLKLRDLLQREDEVMVAAGSVRVRLQPWGIALFSPRNDVPGYSFFR
jgi:alpha-glucosidase